MFTADEIEARLRRQPFVPVRVLTSLGQNYDITRPHQVMIGRRAIIIGIPDRENPELYENATQVALMYVTDVQELPHVTVAEA